jgi:flagellar hook assembly protein FlgD
LPKPSDDLLPQDFALEQNYPNPFNPQTSIPYSLNSSEFVSLEIFIQNGQLVKTLINGYKSAGIYEVTWDGTNNQGIMVASGPYFYTLRVGNQKISTRQMFLIK